MTARTRWGLEALEAELGDDDPFAKPPVLPATMAPVETAVGPRVDVVAKGVPIELDPDRAPTLNERYVELFNEEAALDAQGVRCSLKDLADMACSACPIGAAAPAYPLSHLCKVGVEQERVLARIHVEKARG